MLSRAVHTFKLVAISGLKLCQWRTVIFCLRTEQTLSSCISSFFHYSINVRHTPIACALTPGSSNSGSKGSAGYKKLHLHSKLPPDSLLTLTASLKSTFTPVPETVTAAVTSQAVLKYAFVLVWRADVACLIPAYFEYGIHVASTRPSMRCLIKEPQI